MDDPDFPVINGKFDNVTESAYLKALIAAGLTPDSNAKPTAKRSKLSDIKSTSRGKLKAV